MRWERFDHQWDVVGVEAELVGCLLHQLRKSIFAFSVP